MNRRRWPLGVVGGAETHRKMCSHSFSANSSPLRRKGESLWWSYTVPVSPNPPPAPSPVPNLTQKWDRTSLKIQGSIKLLKKTVAASVVLHAMVCIAWRWGGEAVGRVLGLGLDDVHAHLPPSASNCGGPRTCFFSLLFSVSLSYSLS